MLQRTLASSLRPGHIREACRHPRRTDAVSVHGAGRSERRRPPTEGPCPSPKLRSADIVTSRMLNGRHAGERGWASRHATGHGGVATCLETRRGYANGGQITRSKHNVVIAEAMVRLDGRAKRSYAAMISALIGGRPIWGLLESFAQ
jgi:hypothetical protein